MKRLSALICVALAILAMRPASAIVVLMKAASTTTPVPFLLVDSATGQTGQTGETGAAVNTPVTLIAGVGGSITITVYKPGGTAYANGAGSVVERGNGVYEYQPTGTEDASTGLLYVHATCSGCQTVDSSAQVIAVDPNDATAFGLSRLDAAVSSRSTYAGADTSGTTTLLSRLGQSILFDGSGYVKANAQTVADKTGYSLTQSFPANFSALSISGGGLVALTTAEHANITGDVWSATASSYNVSGTMGNKLNSAASAGDPWSTALPGSYASGSAGYIVGNNLNAAITSRLASGNVTVGGYASGQDPVTLLFAGSFLTIPSSHTTTGVSEVLTYKQWMALQLSIMNGDYTATTPIASGSQTVTYYLTGEPRTSGNIVAIATATYNGSLQLSGRTYQIVQPFPAIP